MALFDSIQMAAFSGVTNVFGDAAEWTSTKTQESFTAKVLFKNPNDPITIGEADKLEYRPYNFSVEYYETDFVGLKDLVDAGQPQMIVVKGFTLLIREVRARFDGKTLTAYGGEVINE